MSIETVNPSTDERIKLYSEMTDAEVMQIIEASLAAFLKWRDLDFNLRAQPMLNLATNLRKGKKEFATLIAHEMGKPLAQGIAEIEKCALTCEHYAKNAAEYLQPRIIKTEMSKSYVTYQPLGVIFAIMPWNFPFWQVIRFAAPTIMAGNTALLKHAPISTGTALTIEKLFAESGFLDNVFRTLIIADDNAHKVISHSSIQAVTLTGSTRAGKIVGAQAASEIKKSVLELGGSDPYLILADADLELAATACVTSRLNNSGQSCIAAKRFITVDPIHEKFVALLQEKIKNYKMGDPMDDTVTLGPLARRDLRDTVHAQVTQSVANGATLLTGGKIPEQKGYYYPPTILLGVHKGMPAYDEEIFGPVFSVIQAQDEVSAIAIANDVPYGLGAAIFTKDISRGEKIAVENIQAGCCSINTFVASDPRLPFGGIKNSGYGRELSLDGIHSFVNIKTINIK